MRDYQRSKLYRAESVVISGSRKFETVPEVQAYVDKLLGSAWFKRRWSDVAHRGIEVKDGRGRQRAVASRFGRYIKLPRWSRTEAVILHEIAHCVTPRGCAAHGREFCRNYLELIGRQLGKKSRRKLQSSFVDHRVRHRGSDQDWLERAKRLREKRAARAESRLDNRQE